MVVLAPCSGEPGRQRKHNMITRGRDSASIWDSEYEAKVYVTLIETGYANARTLSAKSGVPRTKVYSVLKKLIDINLVVEIPEEPRRFSPVSPETALKTYLKSYQNMAENLVSIVSSLDDTFKKTKKEEKLQKGELWVIIGRQQILKKIHEMLSKAKQSVDLVTNENGWCFFIRSSTSFLMSWESGQ